MMVVLIKLERQDGIATYIDNDAAEDTDDEACVDRVRRQEKLDVRYDHDRAKDEVSHLRVVSHFPIDSLRLEP